MVLVNVSLTSLMFLEKVESRFGRRSIALALGNCQAFLTKLILKFLLRFGKKYKIFQNFIYNIFFKVTFKSSCSHHNHNSILYENVTAIEYRYNKNSTYCSNVIQWKLSEENLREEEQCGIFTVLRLSKFRQHSLINFTVSAGLCRKWRVSDTPVSSHLAFKMFWNLCSYLQGSFFTVIQKYYSRQGFARIAV